jgi:hypothetical protein
MWYRRCHSPRGVGRGEGGVIRGRLCEDSEFKPSEMAFPVILES